MQAPRTSTKAVDAMDSLIDLSHRIHADGQVTPIELAEYRTRLMEAAHLVGKADAQLSIGMVALKSGPDSDRYRQVVRSSAALVVRGVVESADGVTNLMADQVTELSLRVPSRSRDFR